MAEDDVEIVAIEDLELRDGGRLMAVLLAGQRMRLSLRYAQHLLSIAPEAAALVPSVKLGSVIFWQVAGMGRCGPAEVADSFVDSTSGRTWVSVEWQGATQLIRGEQVVNDHR